MVDIIDEIWPFTISLVIPEGFADIINITAPSSALPGTIVNVNVTILNTGGSDKLFSKLIDVDTVEVVSEKRIFVNSGNSALFTHSVTMPNKNWNLRVDAGHEA